MTPVSALQLPAPGAVAHVAATELAKVLGPAQVSLRDEDRLSYARDMWPKALLWIRQGRIPPPPDLVAWPASEAEVAAVIAVARAHKLAVVPFGAGSGVCGGTIALRGGIALDLKRLETIGRVDPVNLWVEVDAGVIGEVLERNLNEQGYTLGHFPSSIYMSTVGGWLAARSAGQLSNKYGKIEDMVLSLRAVTGAGEVVETPPRPFLGPDLGQVLLGSEGTLCVFTRVRLRVHPVPQHRAFRGLRFKTVEAGVEAMRLLFAAGLRPAVVRLYDPFDTALVGKEKPKKKKDLAPSLRTSLRADLLPAALRKLTPLTLGHPSLMNRAADLFQHCRMILMFEGEPRRTQEEAQEAVRLCEKAGGHDEGEAPGQAWFKKRYDVSYKMSKVVDAGAFADTMEVAATWDRVLPVYQAVRQAAAGLAFVLCHFSHAYPEGCSLYFSLVSSAGSEGDQEKRYDTLWETILEAATGAGANVSHHHGVGVLKAAQLARELGDGRRLLLALKGALDPDGILNPGKLSL
ncbi:MAG: FAD-binding oxidoreductase [Myxococcota bacterium]|nr:FAD-binding oxidoreductase [Myxococcota bacterium]